MADFYDIETAYNRIEMYNPGVGDFLLQIGASQEAIALIESVEDKKLQGKLANMVRKDPGVSLDVLEAALGKQAHAAKEKEPTDMERQWAEELRERLHDSDAVWASPEFPWLLNIFVESRVRGSKSKRECAEESYRYKFPLSDGSSAEFNPCSGLHREELMDFFVRDISEIMRVYGMYKKAVPDSYAAAIVSMRRMAEEETGTAKLMTAFTNGWSVVEIVNEADFLREGRIMQHCIGNCATYAEDLARGDSKYFSLRDTQNKPHATVEANIIYRAVRGAEAVPKLLAIKQIRGKQNDDPIPEYVDMLRAWLMGMRAGLSKQGVDVCFDRPEEDDTGIISVEDVKAKLGIAEFGGISVQYGIPYCRSEATFINNMHLDTLWILFRQVARLGIVISYDELTEMADDTALKAVCVFSNKEWVRKEAMYFHSRLAGGFETQYLADFVGTLTNRMLYYLKQNQPTLRAWCEERFGSLGEEHG